MGIDVRIGFRTEKPATKEQLDAWNKEFMSLHGDDFDFYKSRIAIGPMPDYYFDDDPEFKDCLYDVAHWSRAYSIGYERGDGESICEILMWIHLSIKPVSVYHWHDHCDWYDIPISQEEVIATWKHWCTNKRIPYQKRHEQ